VARRAVAVARLTATRTEIPRAKPGPAKFTETSSSRGKLGGQGPADRPLLQAPGVRPARRQ
jgi:hypothetical protein